MPEQAIYNFKKVRTAIDAARIDAPVLSSIKREFSQDDVITLISLYISDTILFIGVQNTISLDMIRQVATMIYNDFYYMNIADIYLVFNNAKKGIYGDYSYKIGGNDIYKWFNQYNEERFKAIERRNIEQHQHLKHKNPEIPQDARELVLKAITNIVQPMLDINQKIAIENKSKTRTLKQFMQEKKD